MLCGQQYEGNLFGETGDPLKEQQRLKKKMVLQLIKEEAEPKTSLTDMMCPANLDHRDSDTPLAASLIAVCRKTIDGLIAEYQADLDKVEFAVPRSKSCGKTKKKTADAQQEEPTAEHMEYVGLSFLDEDVT